MPSDKERLEKESSEKKLIDIEQIEVSFYKSLVDDKYHAKLKDMVTNSSLNLEEAIFFLNDTIIHYKDAMRFSDMGYSISFICDNYFRLLRRHEDISKNEEN